MRENCLQDFQAHWNCLENNNQVRTTYLLASMTLTGHGPPGVQQVQETGARTQQVHVREACEYPKFTL